MAVPERCPVRSSVNRAIGESQKRGGLAPSRHLEGAGIEAAMARKRKFCIIMPSHWSGKMGGAEYQLKCLIDKLEDLELFQVYYLAKFFDPEYKPWYTIQKIGSSDYKWSRLFFLDTLNLYKQLNQIKPDLILQRRACAYTGIATHYSLRHGCEMIFHVCHDNDVLDIRKKNATDRMERKYIDYGLQFCPNIVTQTEQQATYLKQRYGRVPIAVVPNFHPLPEESIAKTGPVKIVWVANMKPLKQPEYFIRLAKELEKKNGALQFGMIGRRYPQDRWQSNLENQMLQVKNLTYYGFQPIEKVNSMLGAAHIFVSTSELEGFPNTFIQAWMRKVPVVSLRFDPDDVIKRNQIGYVAENFETMLERISFLINHPSVCHEMGDRAQAYSFSKHSTQAVDSMVDVLKTVGKAAF